MNGPMVSLRTKTQRVSSLTSPQAKQLMTLSHNKGWDFLVLGQAPYPRQPVRLGDWQIVPLSQDQSQMPARTLERVRAIYETGLRPKGFVLVHEAPKLLNAPAIGSRPTPTKFSALLNHPMVCRVGLIAAVGLIGTTILALLGLALVAVALIVAAVAAVAFVALVAVLAVGALAVDPILVAVTEDDYWVEVDRWLV